jgi:tetratricopeptide (TPR) repeat protein
LPGNAGETRALTEAQARIDALLSAGFVQTATRFMENEEELTTPSRVPGLALIRFRNKLRLLFLQRDWSGIASTTMPEELADPYRTAATETLGLFRALAALHNPKGDREGAEQLLAGLQNRQPNIAAYAINLFAARISLLLAGNLFAELSGADLVRGRQMLLDAEDMMRRARGVTPEDSAIFDSNKAILLLALREPQQAMELLTRLRSIRLDDAIAAYTAVALARAGHPAEAIAAVDQAETELGESEVLAAARAHIQAKRPFEAIPNTTLEDEPLAQIDQAQAYAFISYVRENSEVVDRLTKELRDADIQVWVDRDDIMPGQYWKDAINDAIQKGAFFIACYSQELNARQETYMHGELRLATDRLRLMPRSRIWFIPVLLNETEIPAHSISDHETLRDINAIRLYEDWDKGLQNVLRAMKER